MLKATGINQYYGESHILWDAELSLEAGSFTCLMGRNGVGKTTFLKVLMGLLPARTGSLSLEGKEFRGQPPEQRPRLGLAYVPQGREIFSGLDVEENLLLGLVALRRPAKVPDHIYDLFPVLKKMARRRGGDLSGGQQQQLAIARALLLDPKVLILDEPTEGIQPNIVHEIGDILMKLNNDLKLTILIVEQKLPFARRVGKHFVLMDRGKTVAQGLMRELTDDLVHRHMVV